MEIKIFGIYKHFKGTYYIVEGIAKSSETLEDLVIYRGLYDDYQLWVRPLSMFFDKVDKIKYPNAMQTYRFEEVNLTNK